MPIPITKEVLFGKEMQILLKLKERKEQIPKKSDSLPNLLIIPILVILNLQSMLQKNHPSPKIKIMNGRKLKQWQNTPQLQAECN